MPGVTDLKTIWSNIKEFELQPIRDAALKDVRLALVGELGVGRHTLAEQLRRDPDRPDVRTQAPLMILDLDSFQASLKTDLVILLIDATCQDVTRQQALAQNLRDTGRKALVLCNKMDLLGDQRIMDQWAPWDTGDMLYGSVKDLQFLKEQFVPAILRLLPDDHLALGRQFPLFRLAIARQYIGETCFANATYAFSTGLAEIVPVLDLPLNLTDIVILTKSQALLVYRLGLLVGFSMRWQDYITEFGGVIGGGFVWRQVARQLIGLIPMWGIVPKVAVAYAGTYVVGQTVLQWYLTGRNLSRKQLNALYRQALQQGKENARRLLARVPRPRLGKKKKQEELPPPQEIPLPLEEPAPVASTQVCTRCGKTSAVDAIFCQYCGERLDTL